MPEIIVEPSVLPVHVLQIIELSIDGRVLVEHKSTKTLSPSATDKQTYIGS